MQIKDSLYHKLWSVEGKGKVKKVKFGDRKKNQDGSYESCIWFGIVVGKAAEQFDLEEGDVFHIRSGQVFTNKGTDDKYYTSVTIFAFEKVEQDGQKKEKVDLEGTPFEEVEPEDADFDLPF
jgi:hypothetical protein